MAQPAVASPDGRARTRPGLKRSARYTPGSSAFSDGPLEMMSRAVSSDCKKFLGGHLPWIRPYERPTTMVRDAGSDKNHVLTLCLRPAPAGCARHRFAHNPRAKPPLARI